MSEPLPIYEIENDIIATLAATRRLVLQAPTGSGKSTQVPQILIKHGLLGNGQVVMIVGILSGADRSGRTQLGSEAGRNYRHSMGLM